MSRTNIYKNHLRNQILNLSLLTFTLSIVDYPDYSENFANYGAQVKYEDGEEKFKPSEDDRLRERENGQNYGHEEGEYDDRDYN